MFFSACGMRSGMVNFCFIFFCVWNALWYSGFCVLFLCVPVERNLVFWNFVLYISVCGTCSNMVEFCVV